MHKFSKITKSSNIIVAIICLGIIAQIFIFPNIGAFANEKDSVIVSLGDSFSSGEGIPPFYDQDRTIDEKAKSTDWLAHRSKDSWPGQLRLSKVQGMMSEHRGSHWYFAATSGATTYHLTNEFEKNYDTDNKTGSEIIPPQLDVFKELGDKKADFVTVTLGGNDANFVNIIINAAYSTINPESLSISIDGVWSEFYREGGIRDKLKKAYYDIASAAGPQATIVVAGYPKLISENGNSILFKKENVMLLNKSISKFNDEIESLVDSCKTDGINICFVSVEEAFEGHEAYSADPYINPVMVKQNQDLTGFLISAYSIHPNKKGAEIYAQCVQKKIDEIEGSLLSNHFNSHKYIPMNCFKSITDLVNKGITKQTNKTETLSD